MSLHKEAHIWRADLIQSQRMVDRLARFLSPDEQTRADRYCFAEDRRRFQVGRGLLRAILGTYLGIDPRDLIFCYGKFGKPALTVALPGSDYRFNVAHTRDRLLIAVTRGRDIGVDLEAIRDRVKAEGIADRFFAPEEVAALRALPEGKRLLAFFICWARKEAFVKAKGGGLSLGFDQFAVTVPPEPPRLLHACWDAKEAARWHLEDLDTGADYAAALAIRGSSLPVRYLNWPDDS